MDGALQATSPEQAQALHRDWISTLLSEYYDPMYRFQRQAKSTQIVMTGDRQAVLDYLAAYTPPTA
jgi:tRNA 2-selenouridine synthase